MNNHGEFIIGENDSLKTFYIWDALKLRENNIHSFNRMTFMSTHKDPSQRVELSVVKTGFFRYKKGNYTSETFDGDSDSLSHSIAIQVLSEMNDINFIISDSYQFKLKVNNCRTDDLKIQLTNRDKFSYYYPDIIYNFSQPDDLAIRWGGKLALEVKHTHACDREKISDFESHGIPIIEVNIENISIEKKFNTKNPTPEILEKYYNYLKVIFCDKVYGKILSNPVSVSWFNSTINEKKQ